MPPKRKALSAALEESAPATKRTLRSRQIIVPTATTSAATRRSKRNKSYAEPTLDTTSEIQGEHLNAPPSRTRKSSVKPVPSSVAGPSTLPPEAHESSTTTHRERHANSSDEPDELLLTPGKRLSARPVTPPRVTGTPRVGTPRTFMQCVEIVTPSRMLSSSPAPRSARKPLGNSELLNTLRSSTPSPTKRLTNTPASPSKLRSAQVVHGHSSPRTARAGTPPIPISPPASPVRRSFPTITPATSPFKRRATASAHASPTRQSRILPPYLYPALYAQQRAILKSLSTVPDVEAEAAEDEGPSTNATAYEQLTDLLKGTVVRGEGNSCLLIGPRGSGKTRVVEHAIAALPEKPILIRLSGFAQHNDRLAIREIARQLTQQTGSSFLSSEEENSADSTFSDPENPFVDAADMTASIAIPAPAHLLALISMIPTLPRATVVILDAFDQFATHARQSLLYCLLDTTQSCRVSKGNRGLAVIGVTTRVDTINLLEKRVKSRFSGRMLRTACPGRLQDWLNIARAILTAPREAAMDVDDEWETLWAAAVDDFLQQDGVIEALRESYVLTRDVHTLRRILTPSVLELSPEAPFLSSAKLIESAGAQRCPPRFPFLSALPYPAICLLIAAMHAQTSGHDVFTFEMLHEAFRDQVRTSQSAPVQVDGGSIGMVRCSREVLVGAFERLVSMRLFVAVAAPSNHTGKEFILHRCAVDRADVKKAVEMMGQTNLKKWLNKMQ